MRTWAHWRADNVCRSTPKTHQMGWTLSATRADQPLSRLLNGRDQMARTETSWPSLVYTAWLRCCQHPTSIRQNSIDYWELKQCKIMGSHHHHPRADHPPLDDDDDYPLSADLEGWIGWGATRRSGESPRSWSIFIARQHTADDARYWYSNSVRPSICLSVRPWHAGIVWKRLNISS